MEIHSIRIPETTIQSYYDDAFAIIENAEVMESTEATSHPGRPRFISPIPGSATPTTKSKANWHHTLAKINGDDPILSPSQHAVLYNTRRALAVALAVSQFFVEPIGYLDLSERKRKSGLNRSEEDRFKDLIAARALTAAFVAAAHLLHNLDESAAPTPSDPGEPPTNSTTDALSWFIHRLAKATEKATNDDDLGPLIARAAQDIIERIETDSHRLMADDLPTFLATTYTIEQDDFRVHGFELSLSQKTRKPLIMAFKKPHEVIGNHIAKSQAQKLAKMLVAYDFERQKNPFVELGGFLFTFIGDGVPGTGKTTLIQMTAGLIKDYCDMGGYSFQYENFGIDQISEYQGKSGQNCRAFINRITDPNSIGFGTIDDIDQVAGKRNDRHSSSGQQEVTAILMEAFSGTNTLIRGNCTFGMFSNYPEKVDDALRQRAGARWLVDGPQSRADYIDIFHLLLGDNHMIDSGAHDLYANQNITNNVTTSYQHHERPHEERLTTVWEQFTAQHGEPRTLADFGTYLHAIKQAEPRFTGRAIKNITDAIKYRAMDIELPDEWFATPEVFLHRSFDKKITMIKTLQQPITQDMILQEINRYADSELRYTAKSDESTIETILRDHRIHTEAAKRIEEADQK